jgi:hypothetical protein
MSLKYLVRSDGSIGVCAAGSLASESDVKELGEVSRRLVGCGAKLVHLDLDGPCAVDRQIVAPIIMLQRQLEEAGCDFEVRVSDPGLMTALQELNLDRTVRIREIRPEEGLELPGGTVAS